MKEENPINELENKIKKEIGEDKYNILISDGKLSEYIIKKYEKQIKELKH